MEIFEYPEQNKLQLNTPPPEICPFPALKCPVNVCTAIHKWHLQQMVTMSQQGIHQSLAIMKQNIELLLEISRFYVKTTLISNIR